MQSTFLLRDTDEAVASPCLRPDFAKRVRQCKHRRDVKHRWITTAAATSTVLLASILGVYEFGRPHASKTTMDAAAIARLRAEADSIGAEAEALERQLDLERSARSQQDLRDQYRNELAKAAVDGTMPSATDRAALVALGQGDFYLDSQRSLDEAKAQYQSVTDKFPDSRWAQIARDRLNRLKMD
jgi:hypothetical protein